MKTTMHHPDSPISRKSTPRPGRHRYETTPIRFAQALVTPATASVRASATTSSRPWLSLESPAVPLDQPS